MTKTQECKDCKKRFRILTSEDNCYYCFTKEHGVSPSPKQYGGHDKKADNTK